MNRFRTLSGIQLVKRECCYNVLNNEEHHSDSLFGQEIIFHRNPLTFCWRKRIQKEIDSEPHLLQQ
jgi:hypothetical protein